MIIASPKDGAVLSAGDITVSVQTSNFNLADKLGQANVSHEGHLHYFLDVDAPTTQGQPAVPAAGTYAATAATSYTWKNVPAGTHKLSVELINNDHTPLNPPVVATVTVTVQAASTVPPAPQTISLTAQNMAFNTANIAVPAGASVTINFNNMDAGIQHNFAIYTDATAYTLIFRGNAITGPATTTYTFTAPSSPGNYFFRCDVHPTQMTGTFVVR